MPMPFAEYWFTFEDVDSLNLAIRIMQTLKIPEIRTCFSWADWERPGGREWFDYFIGRLNNEGIRLMPCLFYTPMQKARAKPGNDYKTSFAPKRLEDYADFVVAMIQRYGKTFDWIQFWNEPNWHVYWDQDLDPDGRIFAEMVKPACLIAHDYGKKVVLGGLSPYDPAWIRRMNDFGILRYAQAVGIHAFPGTWDEGMDRRTDSPWKGLSGEIGDLKEQLRELDVGAEAWYTETGYSTWGDASQRLIREQKQIDFFGEVLSCGADRVFWHTLIDQPPESPTDNQINLETDPDARAYFFGVTDVKGNPKPIFFHWKEISSKNKQGVDY